MIAIIRRSAHLYDRRDRKNNWLKGAFSFSRNKYGSSFSRHLAIVILSSSALWMACSFLVLPAFPPVQHSGKDHNKNGNELRCGQCSDRAAGIVPKKLNAKAPRPIQEEIGRSQGPVCRLPAFIDQQKANDQQITGSGKSWVGISGTPAGAEHPSGNTTPIRLCVGRP